MVLGTGTFPGEAERGTGEAGSLGTALQKRHN